MMQIRHKNKQILLEDKKLDMLIENRSDHAKARKLVEASNDAEIANKNLESMSSKGDKVEKLQNKTMPKLQKEEIKAMTVTGFSSQ